ncbi:MAG: hypothetical protein VX771_00790, partial [Pseudomonadota bacterium]|nr:hypothetical protein [Pseudomonadota bacterium]
MSTDYLKLWSESDLIRAIDYQLARQAVEWEARYGNTSAQDQQALLLTACAVSYVLGRGQVCLELSAWPKALAVSPEHLPTTDQLTRCQTVSIATSEADTSALFVVQGDRVYLNRY